MQPKGIRNSPEVAPGSQNPSPMDVASVLSKMPSPCVNARGLGQSRGRGRGRDSQVTASSQAIPSVERPTRAKKNHRPAQVVLDYTIQRRTQKQIKANQVKAKTDAAAAEAAAIARKQSQLAEVAAIEDAMQAEDEAQSLEYLRPDLRIAPEVDMLEQGSYHESSHSEDFLTGWKEVKDHTVIEEKNYNDEDEDEGKGEEYTGTTMLSNSETEASQASQASEDHPQALMSSPGTKRRGKHQQNVRGNFRAAVNDARQVLPPPPHLKKRKAIELHPPVDGSTSTKPPKRIKASEPGGLVSNWKRKLNVGVGLLQQIARKHPIEFVDEDDNLFEGEFDKAEGLESLDAVHSSKPPTVRIKPVVAGTKITPRPIFKNPNSTRSRKVVVDNLPFPHPRMQYNSRWQKVFRPTLLSWASTYSDPYATNTQLDELVVLEMWDMIFPDIDLDGEDRSDTGVKLLHLAGHILHDWRSAIGTGALNVVKNYFTNPANGFHKERIASFVRWGLDPKKFNFIYSAPDAKANQKQGFRSELILNVYAIHLKKVAGAATSYGEQYGALALCTAAAERALSFWASGEDMSTKMDDNGRRKLAASFGETEWGPKTRGWSQSTSRLSDEQWMAITTEATARVKGLPQDEPNDEGSQEVDLRAVLEL